MSIKLFFNLKLVEDETKRILFESEMQTRVKAFYPDHDVSVIFHDSDDFYEVDSVRGVLNEGLFNDVIKGIKSDVLFYSLGVSIFD